MPACTALLMCELHANKPQTHLVQKPAIQGQTGIEICVWQ